MSKQHDLISKIRFHIVGWKWSAHLISKCSVVHYNPYSLYDLFLFSLYISVFSVTETHLWTYHACSAYNTFSSLPVCNSSLNPGISLLLFLDSPVCHPASPALPCHWLIWVICCLAKTGNETFHSSPVAAPLSKATGFLHRSPLPNELILCA